MLVLTSTCKEWAPVTGTVTFPKGKRGSARSALARCTFSLQKTWKSMDRVHSGLTFGPLGVQIAWVFSFKVQTWPHRDHSGLTFGPQGVQIAWRFSFKSANLASTMTILGELLAPGAQTGIIIDFTLLQKPVCGPISVAIHPSMHASMHPSTSQSTSLWL